MAKSYTFTAPLAIPVNPSATPAAGGSLAVNTTYYYRVAAVTGASYTDIFKTYGPLCEEFSGTTTVANRTLNLSWNAVGGADGYIVVRTTTSGMFSFHSRVAPSGYVWSTGSNSLSDDGNVGPATYPPWILELSTKTLPMSLDKTKGIGKLDFSGGTIGDPVTFQDVYDWMVANGHGVYVAYDGVTFALLGVFSPNNAVETHFLSTNEVFLCFAGFYVNLSHPDSVFQWGELDVNNIPYKGSMLIDFKPRSGAVDGYFYSQSIKLYDSVIRNCDDKWIQGFALQGSRVYLGDGTYKKVLFERYPSQLKLLTNFTFEDITLLKGGIFSDASTGGSNIDTIEIIGSEFYPEASVISPIKNMTIVRGDLSRHVRLLDTNRRIRLYNPSFKQTYEGVEENPLFSWAGTGNTSWVEVYYEFQLKVVDSNGNGIGGASVVIKDISGTEVFSGGTDANGDIVKQDLLAQKYIHKIGTGSGYGNDYTTKTAYTPHTITISKAGYVTRVMIYDLDRKREEIEMLDVADLTPPTFAGLASAVDLGTQSEVALTWVVATDAGSGVAGYRIYYSQTNNSATIIAAGIQQIAEATTTGARIAGLVDNYTYYFIVRAFDWDDNEDTNVVIHSATPTAPDPVEVAITVNITEDTIVGDVIEVAVADDVVSDVVSSDVLQVAVVGDTASDAVSGDVTD